MAKVDKEFYERLIKYIEPRIAMIQSGQAGADLYDYERQLLADALHERVQDAKKALRMDFIEYTTNLGGGDDGK